MIVKVSSVSEPALMENVPVTLRMPNVEAPELENVAESPEPTVGSGPPMRTPAPDTVSVPLSATVPDTVSVPCTSRVAPRSIFTLLAVTV